MSIQVLSKTEKTKPLTSPYLDRDLEKIEFMGKVFGVKERHVPVICVRIVFPICRLFESQYLRDIVHEVKMYFDYEDQKKHYFTDKKEKS